METEDVKVENTLFEKVGCEDNLREDWSKQVCYSIPSIQEQYIGC